MSYPAEKLALRQRLFRKSSLKERSQPQPLLCVCLSSVQFTSHVAPTASPGTNAPRDRCPSADSTGQTIKTQLFSTIYGLGPQFTF
jgi:hypothetical protein